MQADCFGWCGFRPDFGWSVVEIFVSCSTYTTTCCCLNTCSINPHVILCVCTIIACLAAHTNTHKLLNGLECLECRRWDRAGHPAAPGKGEFGHSLNKKWISVPLFSPCTTDECKSGHQVVKDSESGYLTLKNVFLQVDVEPTHDVNLNWLRFFLYIDSQLQNSEEAVFVLNELRLLLLFIPRSAGAQGIPLPLETLLALQRPPRLLGFIHLWH